MITPPDHLSHQLFLFSAETDVATEISKLKLGNAFYTLVS